MKHLKTLRKEQAAAESNGKWIESKDANGKTIYKLIKTKTK